MILFLIHNLHNTPTIIQYGFWKMTGEHKDAAWIREKLFAPDERKKKAVCINGDIGVILDQRQCQLISYIEIQSAFHLTDERSFWQHYPHQGIPKNHDAARSLYAREFKIIGAWYDHVQWKLLSAPISAASHDKHTAKKHHMNINQIHFVLIKDKQYKKDCLPSQILISWFCLRE